jgi:chromosome partitioning protein
VKVLACYNIKGGVGKTSAAVNLSFLSAQQGFRSLVWDLDPQGAASYCFRIKPRIKAGAVGLVHKKHNLSAAIKGTDYENLDLIPADFSYRNMDLVLEDAKRPLNRLCKVLKPLAGDYDYVFLDCPPGISLASESVFHAANALLVPTIPTTLSLRTLEQLLRFCRKNALDELKIMPFFSMVDKRKSLHRQIVTTLPQQLSLMLITNIPYASDIEQMSVHRAALGSYAANSPSARSYEQLWWEIKVRLEK